MKYLLGVDGGGTGCRVTVTDLGQTTLGTGQSGPANIMTDLDGAFKHIMIATNQALTMAGLNENAYAETCSALGVAGANVGDNAQQLMQKLPFAHSSVISDATIALQGAIGNQDGVTVILGTGSVFIARKDDTVKMIGGWGFHVSDLSGGARLGQKLLEETLLCHDAIQPQSPLSRTVLQRFDNDPNKIVYFCHNARPHNYGKFAPLIFDFANQQDWLAEKILNQAVCSIEAALTAIMDEDHKILSLIGGLGELYSPLLGPKFQAVLQKPKGDALQGAIALAARAHDQHIKCSG